MASVNTNAAAITALRTLQQTNNALDTTQKRISTGYKIGEAKDNAAYWSISTTLKSDNKALSTVKDALNLGASTVDTAYQGLNKAKEVLDEIKSKLTAATQDGVDKGAVQDEITELQKQLKSIATSSTFSGENWLAVDSAAAGYSATKQVVSSFSRDANSVVTLGTIEIDASSMALTNASTTAEGILDGGKQGNVNKGGMADILGTASAAGTGYVWTPGTPTANTGGASGTTVNKLLLSLTVNNESYTLEVSAAANNTAFVFSDFTNAIAANTALGAVMTITGTGLADMAFTSVKKGADTSVVVNNSTFVPGAGNTTATFTAAAGSGAPGTAAKATNLVAFSNGTNGIDLDDNDTIGFAVSLDGATKKSVLINKAVVDKALGTTDGVVNTVDNYVRVLNQALSNAGLGGTVVAGKDGGNHITFTGGRGSIALSDTAATKGTDILSMNIVGKDKNALAAYLSAVSTAIDRVTSAAATLGSVASRVDMQKSFIDTLMDTIDKGVSGLIDADMSEESTKLQALQVKQQLGTQALSIANQGAQNILSLFRS